MTARMHAGAHVVFAFDAALDAARRLWALADVVEAAASPRRSATSDALVGFLGPVADAFAERAEREAAETGRVVVLLRADARTLAASWAAAMDEENRVRRAVRTTELKDRRSLLERLGDVLTGFDEWPAAVPPVAVPCPPTFVPTAEPVRYPR